MGMCGKLGTMVRVFNIDAELWKAFPKCVCGASPPQSASSEIRKAFSGEAEVFFRRSGKLLSVETGAF